MRRPGNLHLMVVMVVVVMTMPMTMTVVMTMTMMITMITATMTVMMVMMMAMTTVMKITAIMTERSSDCEVLPMHFHILLYKSLGKHMLFLTTLLMRKWKI